MTKPYYYRVADFLFSLNLPEDIDIEMLLPSFGPFRTVNDMKSRHLFDFMVMPSNDRQRNDNVHLLEDVYNDMGHLRLYTVADGYMIEIINDCYIHYMVATPNFSSVKVYLQWNDKNVGQALSSLIRITYAQAILFHAAVSVHAAAVSSSDKAYLFMGTSGTGKSTHASLWVKYIPGTELLNDDNPTVRIVCGKAYAYGTPWSGKTACYKDLSFPIGGMVRLSQAQNNRFSQLEGVEAFIVIYPGCSVIAHDEQLRNRLYDTLASLAGMVTVGIMECLPNKDAALLCHQALAKGYDRE